MVCHLPAFHFPVFSFIFCYFIISALFFYFCFFFASHFYSPAHLYRYNRIMKFCATNQKIHVSNTSAIALSAHVCVKDILCVYVCRK